MLDNIKKNKELQKLIFVSEMNSHYLSPREIEFRIPKELKDEKILDLILGMRRYKAELVIPLESQQSEPFRYGKIPSLERMLHEIDIQRSRWQETKTPSLLKELLVRSLIDEAFYSSRIEGAKTTRSRAEDLVRKGGIPQDRSEQMCLNNFRTMEFILENLNRDLSEEFVCEIHRITTEKTLDPQDEAFSGKYRNDQNYVVDEFEKTLYVPPPASELKEFMQRLYDWVNMESSDFLFMHPVIKGSIIHFYTVYAHPFFDGNGRTARALMYHYLLKHDYGFMKFFSISKAIAGKRKAYYEAIKQVEDNEADLTYFLLFSTKMILEAITTVELEKQTEESLVDWLAKLKDSNILLNPRQEKLFKVHFRQTLFPITIKKYQKINRIVYETARRDLLELCDKGLVEMKKQGREFVFRMK